MTLLSDDADTYQVRAVPGRLLDGLPSFAFDDGTHGVYDVDFPDVLAPGPGARFELVYGAGEGAAAVSLGTPVQVLSFGFPLEAVYDEQVRTALLLRSLHALGVPADPMPMDRPPPTLETDPIRAMDHEMAEPGCTCRLAGRRSGPGGPPLLVTGLLALPLLRRGRRRGPRPAHSSGQ